MLTVILGRTKTFRRTYFVDVALGRFAVTTQRCVDWIYVRLRRLSHAVGRVHLIVVVGRRDNVVRVLRATISDPFTFSVVNYASVDLSAKVVVQDGRHVRLTAVVLRKDDPLAAAVRHALLRIVLEQVNGFEGSVIRNFPIRRVLQFRSEHAQRRVRNNTCRVRTIARASCVRVERVDPGGQIRRVLLGLPPIRVRRFTSLRSLRRRMCVVLSYRFL